MKKMDEEIKETLKKQLDLLSERSKNAVSDHDVAELSNAMVTMALAITYPALAFEEQKASRRLTPRL